MKQLAEVVVHGFTPSGAEDEATLRELGYAAQIARGRVDDPKEHLEVVIEYCRSRIPEPSPFPEGHPGYRDPIQAKWGSKRHIDHGKIKTELWLHVMMLERSANGQS